MGATGDNRPSEDAAAPLPRLSHVPTAPPVDPLQRIKNAQEEELQAVEQIRRGVPSKGGPVTYLQSAQNIFKGTVYLMLQAELMLWFFRRRRRRRASAGGELLRVVLTGGPCAGKSTALTRLKETCQQHGYECYTVPEIPTLMIDGGLPFPPPTAESEQALIACVPQRTSHRARVLGA